MEQALMAVERMVHGDRAQAVIAVNPEKVIRAQQDPALLARLNNASLLIPDGIGVVVASRLLGLARMRRVPGSELMPQICGLAARNGYRVFLFGASAEVNAKTGQVLRRNYPGIRIVGQQHGHIKENEHEQVLDHINASQADILFIALGSPRQELWMEKYLPRLSVKVCQGVGGTFDVIAGRVRRAPWLFRQLHLEWFYRLLAQPARIARQSALPLFAWQVVRKRVFG
jgi:N-acetylglucosaminyldiphosphoundecaprenol N-acetyl-beta-D-mannosaminyltransferase